MKFSLLASALVGITLIVTPPVDAGQNNHGKSNHGKKHFYKGNHHKYNVGYPQRHKHYSRHSSHSTANIIGGVIGGVILGSIIHNANNHSSSHSYTQTYSNYPATTQSYYRYNSSTVTRPSTTYRVLNGNECYLRNINKHGNEILTQVPAINCGF
jgi:hypothetical protein